MQVHSGWETETPPQKYEQKRSPQDWSPLSSPSQIQTWPGNRSWDVLRKPAGQHLVPGTPYPNPVKSTLGVCHEPATSREPWDAWTWKSWKPTEEPDHHEAMLRPELVSLQKPHPIFRTWIMSWGFSSPQMSGDSRSAIGLTRSHSKPHWSFWAAIAERSSLLGFANNTQMWVWRMQLLDKMRA